MENQVIFSIIFAALVLNITQFYCTTFCKIGDGGHLEYFPLALESILEYFLLAFCFALLHAVVSSYNIKSKCCVNALF